jgi:hypothetical protein
MALPSPPLPTDNLYKFMAIAGIVAAISCAYFGINILLDLQESTWEVSAQTKVLLARGDAEAEEMEALVQELELLRKKRDELEPLSEFLAKVAGFSLALSVLGFILWYWRVQRFLDKELSRRASQ